MKIKIIKRVSLVVRQGEHWDGENRLNEYLNKGWEVEQMCPMPSAGASNYCFPPSCLVILKRKL